MVKLFNATTTKFRNFFGRSRSTRNASPSPGDQSVDESTEPPPNQKSSVSEDSSLEDDDDDGDDGDDDDEDDRDEGNDDDETDDDEADDDEIDDDEIDDDEIDDDEDDEDTEDDNSVSEDESLEHDDHSVNTMLPSYDQAISAPGNAVTSDSNALCLCLHHQGCCRMHNSLRTPNRGLLDQPGTSSYLVLNTLVSSGTGTNHLNARGLSSLTLKPIHTTIRYHLSLDHLACVRRQFDPGTDTDLVKSLSCNDKNTSKENCRYEWLSDLYFRDGTFLQRQQMRCHLSDETRKSERFVGCPHQTLRIDPPKFKYKKGLLEIQTEISNQPPRCTFHPTESWNSSQGCYTQIVVCTICHSDAECTLEVHGSYLKIKYTCYRDLGPGTSPIHPKWFALLAGEGSSHRQKHDLKLYARVWTIGRKLGRSGISEVTHQTPNGPFNASDELRETRRN